MVFDFDRHLRNLAIDDWKITKKTSRKKINFIARKKSFLSSKSRLFVVFNEEPSYNDLRNFVDEVKRLDDKETLEEALLLGPSCDRHALSKFIGKSGRFSKGRLRSLISFRTYDPKGKVPRQVRKKIIEEETKKPKRATLKKFEKPVEDLKTFKKLCRFASKFEITPLMKRREMDIEQNFWTYLNAKFGKREEIIYEKPKGTGRLDIYFPKRKIGVEFKLIKGKGDLNKVVGQVLNYQDEYNFMCVVLVNIKGYPASEIKKSTKILKTLDNTDVIIR